MEGGIITKAPIGSFQASQQFRLSVRVTDLNAEVTATSYADMQLFVYVSFQPVAFPGSEFKVYFPEASPVGTRQALLQTY
ncbi:unnamed protein product [Protopolystoma xenopodis]|uniref:Cadherin domain-containing protein n=1 Tax=Protopolystoma xenopodis TaxID=117903 RepID=A0A3S5AY77_9PLAT|nr:unnamed protein product [Protopolystoma xenopodis]